MTAPEKIVQAINVLASMDSNRYFRWATTETHKNLEHHVDSTTAIRSLTYSSRGLALLERIDGMLTRVEKRHNKLYKADLLGLYPEFYDLMPAEFKKDAGLIWRKLSHHIFDLYPENWRSDKPMSVVLKQWHDSRKVISGEMEEWS